MPLAAPRRDLIQKPLRGEDVLVLDPTFRNDGTAAGVAQHGEARLLGDDIVFGSGGAADPAPAGSSGSEPAASRDRAFAAPDDPEPLQALEAEDPLAVGALEAGFVDLVVTSFDVTPEPATTGGTVSVTFTVTNQGTANGGPFEADFRLSTDSLITTSDFDLGSVILDDLDVGGSITMTRPLELPSPANPFWAGDADGTFGVGVILSSIEEGPPEDTSNNRAVDTLVIDDGRADLVGTSFNVTQEPLEKGDLAVINISITNEGTAPSGAFDIDFRLSTNSFISTLDFDLGETTVESIAAGETFRLARLYSLPEETDPFWPDDDSLFAIGMRIDSGNDVIEGDEGNNSNEGNLIDYDVLTIL